ncbi:sensor histidine kinase [Amycolatopsis suaedae]|uniref:Sensor histidine kinase n=1 Tax=Amycolatopsis suaedae TaxID=2510978 RepID=A0A4Q7J3S0_9PSEU|nr:sensor histidine kinase [Amycolatopsis suaedae]RZQ61272.1 sensor histidine kinase [Amycolatopsis suaedae]
MDSEPPSSGPGWAGAPAWHGPGPEDAFTHPALFYRTPADYLAATVPFVVGGLARDEPVAVSVPRDNLVALRDAVAASGAPADQVRWLDMTEAGRNPGRIIPGVLRAFADQHPRRRVRIIGEPIWAGRSADEYPACAQHEALINAAFRGREVTILCPYDTHRLTSAVLTEAELTHPVIVEGDRHWTSTGYAPDAVVDTHNQPLPEPEQVSAYPADGITASGLAAIRRWAADHSARAGLDPQRQDDVVLAVNELAANCIDHGHASRLACWTTGSALVFQATNASPGPLSPLAGRLPVPVDHRRGRGLLMINQIADLVRLHTGDGHITVRVYVDLPARDGKPAQAG